MEELIEPFAGSQSHELAGRLIAGFGSLERIVSANYLQLREVAGGHDEACRSICAARRLVDAAFQEELIGGPVAGDDPCLHQYVRSRIGGATDERLLVIYCDHECRYLGDEVLAEGAPGHISVRARPLVQRALAFGATGFLLAHNHPSGVCRPSSIDIAETRRLSDLCEMLELELIDHLIVTRKRVFSMRGGACI